MEGGVVDWIGFYERLVANESQVLATIDDFAKKLSEEAFRAAETTDIEPLCELIAEFKGRANRWGGRLKPHMAESEVQSYWKIT